MVQKRIIKKRNIKTDLKKKQKNRKYDILYYHNKGKMKGKKVKTSINISKQKREDGYDLFISLDQKLV